MSFSEKVQIASSLMISFQTLLLTLTPSADVFDKNGEIVSGIESLTPQDLLSAKL